MKQRMWTRSGFIAVAILLVADRAAAQGAPRELYNKTIQISFNITVPARTSDGRNLSAQRDTTYRIYVSTAGRVFARELPALVELVPEAAGAAQKIAVR